MDATDYFILALLLAAILCTLMWWLSLLKPVEEAVQTVEHGHIIADFLRELADWDRSAT